MSDNRCPTCGWFLHKDGCTEERCKVSSDELDPSQAEHRRKEAVMYWHERAMKAERQVAELTKERDELRDTLEGIYINYHEYDRVDISWWQSAAKLINRKHE